MAASEISQVLISFKNIAFIVAECSAIISNIFKYYFKATSFYKPDGIKC